jgi:hypothetical protein
MGFQLTWDQGQIRRALRGTVSSDPDSVTLRLFNPTIPLGVGLMEDGSVVLIAPGEANDDPISGKYFYYEPWRSVYPANSEVLHEVSILVVTYNGATSDELDALSVLLAGLVSMHSSDNRDVMQGRTISALVALLDARMKMKPERIKQIGLIGELLVILCSQNPSLMIQAWRSRDDAAYDFSSAQESLEVKTTTKTPREHSFSSRQLPVRSGSNLTVLSILLSEVEIGIGISAIFEKISSKVQSSDDRAKLLKCCLETLGTHPSLVEDFQIDLETSLRSILKFRPEEIPTPLLVAGVSQMNWTASIPPHASSHLRGALSGLIP